MRSFSGLFSAACSPSYHYKHYIIFFFQGIIFWRLQHALNLTKLSEFQRQCCFGVQRWASAAGKFCCRSLVFVTPVYNVMIAETLFYKRRGVNATYSQTSLTHHLQQHYFIVKLIINMTWCIGSVSSIHFASHTHYRKNFEVHGKHLKLEIFNYLTCICGGLRQTTVKIHL